MKLRMISRSLGLAGALALAAIVGAPQPASAKTVTIKGSDTMVILGQRWAEQYMKEHPGTVVQVTGGGSGTGIAALINGATDIAEASRPMKPEEKAASKAKSGKDVAEIPVALDGLSIYVDQANPLEKISMPQLKDIYTGKTGKWEDVGAPLGQIVAYGRENNSGTYAFFKEHVLKNEDFAPEILSMPGTAAVINAVSKDKKAIGYGGIAYAKGIKVLKVSRDDQSPAIEATMANVLSGKYPLSRYLFFYTSGQPEGDIKAFINWVLGPEGQKICEKVGYFPLAKKSKPSE
jgi:phosphate transport system substrate-binding protein